jgi:hypothetical protein
MHKPFVELRAPACRLVRLAHFDHFPNNEALKILVSPSASAKHECLGYRECHKAVICIMTRPCEKGKILGFVVLPFVLASNDISDYSSEHFLSSIFLLRDSIEHGFLI